MFSDLAQAPIEGYEGRDLPDDIRIHRQLQFIHCDLYGPHSALGTSWEGITGSFKYIATTEAPTL